MRSMLSSARWPELLTATGEWPIDLDPEQPLPNLWLGVSAEDQDAAELRIPALLNTPAAVRWVSAEPLLGPIDLGFTEPCDHVRYSHLDIGCWRAIDWIVAGGESGAHARPMESGWVRDIRDQCAAVDVPFLFKQWGGRVPKANGRTLDGRTWDEYPTRSEGRANSVAALTMPL